MGKKPAEIEREIAAKRAVISARLETFEGRVANELTDLKRAVLQTLGSDLETPDRGTHEPEPWQASTQ